MLKYPDCPLCQTTGGTLIWQNERLRVIDASDPAYPAFTRVVWKDHIAEMTDLTVGQQTALMSVVLLVEKIQRQTLSPDKINLAAFGNMVPHLHWHIIARWKDDTHFPQPVWAAPPDASPDRQALQRARRDQTASLMTHYHETLSQALGEMDD